MLQSCFAKHMIYLEEHRDVGDSVKRAEELADEHEEYAANAMADVQMARALRDKGDELIAMQDLELSDSLLPKCDELSRMADALTSALDRRTQVLLLSRNMHDQISQANSWCRRGVDLINSLPLEVSPTTTDSVMVDLDAFLSDGENLQLDALKATPNMNNLILLTTTETSSLLAQVAERIDDIRRLGAARRDALHKLQETKKSSVSSKPVQVVSPEKKPNSLPLGPASSTASSAASSPNGSVKSTPKCPFDQKHTLNSSFVHNQVDLRRTTEFPFALDVTDSVF
uniref:Guanine nucleotide exchange factor DBS-like spectrin-like domain-containing protein n=1 Tax=Panagrellus redivivus TaxID=6233 RepID=A0A7E4V5K9_PANRE